MTDRRGFERAVSDWLAEGSDRTPQPAVDAVLLAVKTTPQERDLRIPWRTPTMANALRLVAAIAIIAVVGIAGLNLFGSAPGSGGAPNPTPTPTAAPSSGPPSAIPTAAPSYGAPSANPSPTIDTTTWTTYVSRQYGFTIGHPVDWTEVPATRAWAFETDVDDWLSPAHDAFFASNGAVRVSAWSVPLDQDNKVVDPTWTDVEAWVETYCRQSANGPCTGIPDRAIPLCLEARDCHPGLLVGFQDDVQAFFTIGDQMIAVAVWWAESAPAVAPYGGSQRLLEAFLSTMGVMRTNDPRRLQLQ